MVKGVLANLKSLTYKYVTTDINAITKIFFSRKILKITRNIGVPGKCKCFGQWIYDFKCFNEFMTSYL